MNRARGIAVALAVFGLLGTSAAEAAPAPADGTTASEELFSPITEADILDPSVATPEGVLPPDEADGGVDNNPNHAIAWFRARLGSTAFEGYCERAARLSWNRTRVHPSAIAHWRAEGPRHTTGRPPRGAFVFWNTSKWGHVGVADGAGGFYSTSVRGRIGHAKSVSYFRNYLGWIKGSRS
ncbi:hypothetical protein NLX83_19165 [Allokutzneria sp. A3M-2-11 16]|uniref:hypothetical protein n=1 Tax=Allokutzneria sp. A3M-2-11 16 TaxID=2962043 RepID=UPI0020B70DE2|nr:hypothetical protein [Allokutzneria sp. A3M-2-11 16]MCP3801381.1 hypothetical protein [Allokutzneria sp. A3M-2-11 16]